MFALFSCTEYIINKDTSLAQFEQKITVPGEVVDIPTDFFGVYFYNDQVWGRNAAGDDFLIGPAPSGYSQVRDISLEPSPVTGSENDHIIINRSGTNKTYILPDPISSGDLTGKEIIVKNGPTSSMITTVDAGSSTVEGLSTTTVGNLSGTYRSKTFLYDGTEWVVLAFN